METASKERRLNLNITIVILLAVILGIVFYSGFREGTFLVMVILAALQVYLQGVTVRIGERTDISLGTAAVLPTIYLCGATPIMLISVLLGLYDGIRKKKRWLRTLFNSAQFALAALFATLVFEYLVSFLGGTWLGLVVASITATLIYIISNIGMVFSAVAVMRGVTWWAQCKEGFPVAVYSSFSSGFIGIIFAFFVMSYGFWGVIAFSILLVNLSGLLKAAAEVSAERALRRELEEELVIDEMTGAYNFRYLNNWLSEPSEEEMSLLFMDIDDFGVFNNTYGHAEGDKVLKKLVETITHSVRADDEVIRYGGDEFVVFLRGLDAEGAKRVAGRILDNLNASTNPKWVQPITISLGIATRPQHTEDKRQLLLFADQAMYGAKNAGKNRIETWNAVKDPA